MALPPFTCFYRLVAANESARSEPSGVIPLLPMAPNAPAVFFFADSATRHLMRLTRHPEGRWLTEDLTAREPPAGRECMPCFVKGSCIDHAWMQTRPQEALEALRTLINVTASHHSVCVCMSLAVKAAPAVGSGSPQRFGSSSVLYCGWDQHLYEYNYSTGNVLDHSSAFQVCVCCARVCVCMCGWWLACSVSPALEPCCVFCAAPLRPPVHTHTGAHLRRAERVGGGSMHRGLQGRQEQPLVRAALRQRRP